MEDDTTEDLTSDSEYTGSFIATDDEVEELNWDSEDSRPAGPTPDAELTRLGGLSRNTASRGGLERRRRIRVITLSDSSSSESSSQTPSLTTTDYLSSPIVVRGSESSESDETYFSEPPDSPGAMASPAADPVVPTPPLAPGSPDPLPVAEVLSPSSSDDEAPLAARMDQMDPAPVQLDLGPVLVDPALVLVDPAPNATSRPEEFPLDSSVLSEGDDATLCTICMCPLTNSGTHRVVCLRCGHIFGQACLERWIKVGCNNGAKRCPTCNKKAALKDIRVLYLPKVVPLDTVERDKLIQEKEEIAAQKKMLEADYTRTILQHKLVVEKFEERIAALEKRLQEGRPAEDTLAPLSQAMGLEVVTTVSISFVGGCRVMAFNPVRQDMVVSQPTGNTVFAGFGVRILNSVDWQPYRFFMLHSKAIRDLHFHPEDKDMLLSVSLDQSAKLFDLGANTTVHTFKGEGPLWSCTWDSSHPHLLFLGSQNGRVVQYDRRMTDNTLNMWEVENNRTPVVALASPPSRDRSSYPQGGFLSCRLNSVYSYARQGEKYLCNELTTEGPFMSMRYDDATQMMLTTSRPSSRSPHNRVCLSLLDNDTNRQVCAPLIHTFNCGSSARVMSRSTVVSHVDDSLVVAHNESGRTLNVWGSKRGDHLQSVPIREPIIDLSSVNICDNKPPLLAALSDKTLTVYKINS